MSTRPLAKEPIGAVLPVSFGASSVGEEGYLLHAEGTVTKLRRGYLVALDAHWQAQGPCDRCLDPVAWTQSAHVEETFGPEAGDEVRPIAEGMLDLEPTLAELFLLERPQKILCMPDCAGLCPGCGANLNREPCRCTGAEPYVAKGEN